MSLNLYDPKPEDINYLRQLIANGELTNEQLSQMPIRGGFSGVQPAPSQDVGLFQQPQKNALAQMVNPQEQQSQDKELIKSTLNSNIYDVKDPSQFESLRSKVAPGGGVIKMTMPDGTEKVTLIQERAPDTQKLRKYGYDKNTNTTYDLGETSATFGRGAIPREGPTAAQIPGLGGGYRGPDGNIYGNGWVATNYDRAATLAEQDRQMKIAQMNAQINHTNAQAELEKAKLKSLGTPDKPHYDSERGVYVQMLPNGETKSIPVQGLQAKEKPLTESQAKGAMFGLRAQAAHDILTNLESGGTLTPSLIKQAAEALPGIGTSLGMAVNSVGIPSKNQQLVDQAQRDFVNAALRTESGQAVSASEFDNARKQYFPQPGDSPEVIKQKQENRAREIEGFNIMAGKQPKALPTVDPLTKSKALFDAQKAIAAGANPNAVRARLQSMGIVGGL